MQTHYPDFVNVEPAANGKAYVTFIVSREEAFQLLADADLFSSFSRFIMQKVVSASAMSNVRGL
jgi:hypothetical protein